MAGEEEILSPPEGKVAGKKAGRIDISVPVHDAVTDELCVFKSRYHRKNPLLLRKFEVRLKADEIIKRSAFVFLAKLKNSPRSVAGFRVTKADGFHRAETDCVLSP